MGVSDRDYARAGQPARGGARRSAGVGRMRMWSVNTWIIVANIAVFVLGMALVGRDPQTGKVGPIAWRFGAGSYYGRDVGRDQIKRGEVDRRVSYQPPEMPGYLAHPIFDPQLQAVDPRTGTPLKTLDGKPARVQIGGERYTFKPPLDAIGHFSTGKAFLEGQVWRFLTFQFLHVDLTHLIFNMLGLWFVGGLVEEYLGRRRYLAFYLVSGLFGAVGYLLLNLLGYIAREHLPGLAGSIPSPLLVQDIYTPLVGASAGVFGVLMAAAYIRPTEIVDVLAIIPMKLRTAVYLFLGLAAINLLRGGNNAGGDAAHVGGAIAGAFFIRRAHLLRDFFDLLSDSRKAKTPPEVLEVDRILDKIQEHGLVSLTPKEREVLARQSAAGRAAAGEPSGGGSARP